MGLQRLDVSFIRSSGISPGRGLLGDRVQDDLPPTSIVMNMLLILPDEDREVRPFIETVHGRCSRSSSRCGLSLRLEM